MLSRIRVITTGREVKGEDYGPIYGITIPFALATIYKETKFRIIPNGPNLILESGCEFIKIKS